VGFPRQRKNTVGRRPGGNRMAASLASLKTARTVTTQWTMFLYRYRHSKRVEITADTTLANVTTVLATWKLFLLHIPYFIRGNRRTVPYQCECLCLWPCVFPTITTYTLHDPVSRTYAIRSHLSLLYFQAPISNINTAVCKLLRWLHTNVM
jgi:hypothetical protein